MARDPADPGADDLFGLPAPRRAPTQTVRRIFDAADEIMGGVAPDELQFLHAVLASCALPYRQPPGDAVDFVRTNGRATLILQPGYLLDPLTRKPVRQGLPYGAKPRLLMLHLCSEAVRRQTNQIEVAGSMTAFMRELGLSATGGAQGSIGRFKDQLNRLAATRMQLLFDAGDFAAIRNPAPVIAAMDVWFPTDPRQRMLWPTAITLSVEFFKSLQDHALPLDPRAIRALQHNARALDAYVWLAHRLPRVRSRAGDRVSWAALHGQFGGDQRSRKEFRREFLIALRQVTAVYPTAKVEEIEGALLLFKSRPPIRPNVEVLP